MILVEGLDAVLRFSFSRISLANGVPSMKIKIYTLIVLSILIKQNLGILVFIDKEKIVKWFFKFWLFWAIFDD